jgi:hypothetical protein
VTSAVQYFADLLQKNESNVAMVRRSIECLRVIGNLGNDEQQQKAADYFNYLLTRKETGELISQMIECYFHLAETVKANLVTRLNQLLQLALAKQTDPEEPSEEAIMLEQYLESDLPVTQYAKEHKVKLLAEKDDLKRATGLARTYIGLDDPGAIGWPKWSSFEIMAEIQRTSDENAVAGLREALATVPQDEDQEYKDYAQGRALKAIVFLGGTLDPEQEQWLDEEDETRRFQLQG